MSDSPTTIDEAMGRIPEGWYWERMFRVSTGYLVTLQRADGKGVAFAEDCETLAGGILKACERARNWDKELDCCRTVSSNRSRP